VGEALQQAATLQEDFGFLHVGGRRGQFTQLLKTPSKQLMAKVIVM